MFLWTSGCIYLLELTFSFPLDVFPEVESLDHMISSVQFNCLVLSDSLWPHELQHTRPLCPSPTPGVHWDSRPSSQRCHPAISSSVVPFASCSQSLPASGSFPMSQLFTWGGQNTGVVPLPSPSSCFQLQTSQLWFYYLKKWFLIFFQSQISPSSIYRWRLIKSCLQHQKVHRPLKVKEKWSCSVVSDSLRPCGL